MKTTTVKKPIIVDVDIKVKEITLLTEKEFYTFQDNIFNIHKEWWLKNPSYPSGTIATAWYKDGREPWILSVDVTAERGVRPVIVFEPTESLKVGDTIQFGGPSIDRHGYSETFDWTVISDNMLLCDEIIGKWRFDESTTDYVSSEIKKRLEEWFENQLKN